jgi:hypothetical protein
MATTGYFGMLNKPVINPMHVKTDEFLKGVWLGTQRMTGMGMPDVKCNIILSSPGWIFKGFRLALVNPLARN